MDLPTKPIPTALPGGIDGAEPLPPRQPAEMTVRDAIGIVRQEATKHTGDIRAALTMLADLAQEGDL